MRGNQRNMEEELCGRDPNKPRVPTKYVPNENETVTESGIIVVSADDVKARHPGFTCFGEVGVGFFNPTGLTKLEVKP